MKKFLLTAVVAVFALAANAQVWVGGSIGASTSKDSFNGIDNTTNEVTVAPTIGFTYDDNWDFVLEIGYAHGDSGATTNTFAIAPYARYKFVKAGNLTAFVDGGFSYANVHYNGGDGNANQWRIFIKPGVSYDLSKKVAIDAKFGDLSYAFTKMGDTKNNTFNLKMDSEISFGIYYKF